MFAAVTRDGRTETRYDNLDQSSYLKLCISGKNPLLGLLPLLEELDSLFSTHDRTVLVVRSLDRTRPFQMFNKYITRITFWQGESNVVVPFGK